jgi:hypothetical protein
MSVFYQGAADHPEGTEGRRHLAARHRAGLNDRGIPTPRGGTWAPMQVKNILDRASG